MEAHRLVVLGNRALMVFGSKQVKVTGYWNNEELVDW
jgi:hypothetical protein